MKLALKIAHTVDWEIMTVRISKMQVLFAKLTKATCQLTVSNDIGIKPNKPNQNTLISCALLNNIPLSDNEVH